MPKPSVLRKIVRAVQNPTRTFRSIKHRIRKDGTSRRIRKGSNEQAAKAVAKEFSQVPELSPIILTMNRSTGAVRVGSLFDSPDLPSRIRDPKLTYMNMHAKSSMRAKSEWQHLREAQGSKKKPAFYTGAEAASFLQRFMTTRRPFLDPKDNRTLLEIFKVSPDARLKALGHSNVPLTPEERAEIEDYRIKLDIMIRKGLFEESPVIPNDLKKKLRKIHDDYHRVVAYLDKKVEKRE